MPKQDEGQAPLLDPQLQPDTPKAAEKKPKATRKKNAEPQGGMNMEQLLTLIQQRIDSAMQKREPKAEQAPATPKTPLIFSAIRNAMRDIVPLAKTHEHEDQGFFFRRIDEVLAQLQPIFVQHAIFYLPYKVTKDIETERTVVTDRGSWVQIYTKVTVQWRVYSAIDGSYLECESMGEGMSEQQFSTAAAQTMAEKTMLCDVFSIPVFGAEDPEEMKGERAQSSTKVYYETPQAVERGSAPETPSLFGEDEQPTTKKKRSRSPKDEGPQVTSVGGAPIETSNGDADQSEQSPVVVPTKEEPLSESFIRILKINLTAKKVDEQTLFTHLGVADFHEMTRSHMTQAEAFIKNGGQP